MTFLFAPRGSSRKWPETGRRRSPGFFALAATRGIRDNASQLQRNLIGMKTATFPSLRVDPELRAAAERLLEEGETLSSFVEQSIRDGVQRRQAQREFIARGLKSGNAARRKQDYVPAATVAARLERMLQKAKRSASS
jgi:predicted transcriptional regulator